MRGRHASRRVDAIEERLRFEPERTSKTQIKQLRGMRHPQYRLRVEDTRILYDVGKASWEIFAVVPKSEAAAWLEY